MCVCVCVCVSGKGGGGGLDLEGQLSVTHQASIVVSVVMIGRQPNIIPSLC